MTGSGRGKAWTQFYCAGPRVAVADVQAFHRRSRSLWSLRFTHRPDPLAFAQALPRPEQIAMPGQLHAITFKFILRGDYLPAEFRCRPFKIGVIFGIFISTGRIYEEWYLYHR